jgi:nucleoside-diphosphate-sugar epimerase
MKIFLTGASGFIGKNFYKLATKKGCFIYASSRIKRKNKNNKIKWLKGDFDHDWKKELSSSNILVHLAASGLNSNDDSEIYDTNVFKSINLLNNAIKYKCKKWLIISTSSEYGLIKKNKLLRFNKKSNRIPEDDYGLSKAIFTDSCINLAKKFNCKVRIMRIFFVYGPGENKKRLYPSMLQAAKAGDNFLIKNPYEIRDFTHVKFVSKILFDAMNFNKKRFKSHQIWHVSENKPEMIKSFVKKYWTIHKPKGKLISNKKSNVTFDHISDKESVWK